MPQKTKAQKIAADQRFESNRIQYSYSGSSNGSEIKQSGPKSDLKKFESSKDDYGYVGSDLKRVGIFSLLAFGAEIALWYFLMVR